MAVITQYDFGRTPLTTLNLQELSYDGAGDGELEKPARISHLKALTETIEGEIIPRLLMVHAAAEGSPVWLRHEGTRIITAEDVELFSEMVLTQTAETCIEWVDDMRREGAALEAVFLDLFAASARRLGVLWTEDLRSFVDVTIGLGTLQQVFRHFSPVFERADLGGPRRAFLIPAPEEQHTFGLFLVEAFLHRAGWEVDALPNFDSTEISHYLRNNEPHLVGISVSADSLIDAVRSTVHLVRECCLPRTVRIMVGGKPFCDRPALSRMVGADGTAQDAAAAVEVADGLVPLPSVNRRDGQIN